MRDIDEILHFRSDISPFLVHLARDFDGRTAEQCLQSIIQERQLQCGNNNVSAVRYGGNTIEMSDEDCRRFFGAICFTETPLSETHCLLEISARQVQLQPYGLVFLKTRLRDRGVAPVLYLNNALGTQDSVVQSLFSLTAQFPEAAERLLPLVSVFGRKIQPPRAPVQEGEIDFSWEREWRLPSVSTPLAFTEGDVFVGLCPDEVIPQFETLFPGIGFIDPRRNMKWYASKLISARHRLDMGHSVV